MSYASKREKDRELLIEYVRMHPGCRRVDITDDMGITASFMSMNLQDLRDQGVLSIDADGKLFFVHKGMNYWLRHSWRAAA